MSNNIIVTQGKRNGDVTPHIVSFIHNFEINIVEEVIKHQFDILTEFLNLIVVNLNPSFEVFDVIGEGQESFRTRHKSLVWYISGAL